MLTMRRPLGRLFYCLISIVIAAVMGFPQAPATTAIHDVVYRADGTPAAGYVVISWPAFTTSDQKSVAAGTLTVQLGAGGAFNAALAPNADATPEGVYYKVVYHLEGAGAPSNEAWSVPAAGETTISAVRATVMPASAAVQVASRVYVDAAIAGKAASGANADITSLALGNGAPWLQRDAADALGLWRASSPQRFSVYNTRSDAANYERLSAFWTGDAAYLRTEASGTGMARPLLLGAGDTPSLELESGNATASGVLSADGYLDMSGTAGYAISSDPPAFGGTGVGWKLGLWQNVYAMGIANSTVAVKTGKWFSVFLGNPNNDGGGSSPDTAAGVSLGGDGTIIATNLSLSGTAATAGINDSGTSTFKNFNSIQFAGPGATPTIDQAVTACGANPCTVYISSSYTGAESASVVTNSAGLEVYEGAANITIVDLRSSQETALPYSVSLYPIIYGGRDAGQLTRFGANYLSSGTIPGSTSGGTFFNWVKGTLPADNGAMNGAVGVVITTDTTTVGASTSPFVGVDGEALMNATTQDAPIPNAYGVNGYCSITRTNATGTVTNCAGIHAAANANDSTSGGVITNSYGILAETQTAGSARNYGIYNRGHWLAANNTNFDGLDSAGTVQHLVTLGSDDTITLHPLADANGWNWNTQAGSGLFTVKSAAIISRVGHAFSANAYPATAGAGSLGTATLPWANLYIGSTSTPSASISSAGLGAFASLTIGGGTAITKHLSATATLDFSNTVAPACSDLTITVTGAATGDTVSVATPAPPAGGMYSAWVSATDTVTVRFCALATGNPASGSFRTDVWKH